MFEPDPPGTRPWLARALFLWAAAAGSGATAWLILAGQPKWSGLTALVAAAGLVVRVVPRVPEAPRARFVDNMLDRTFEASVLLPVAWVARTAAPLVSALALLGLGASYVAAYEQIRARSLGYHGAEAPAYRATRAALLVVGLLAGWMRAVLWAFLALTVAAATVRALDVAAQERAEHRSAAQGERR